MEDSTIHPFEKAGLGKAPFTCLGMEEKVGPITNADGSQTGAPGQPMGCCRYCGTGIKYCFLIRSSDGKTFVVGSECVRKTDDVNLTTRTSMLVRQHDRELRRQKDARNVNMVYEIWSNAGTRRWMKSLPHPIVRMGSSATFFDHIDYMFRYGGASGRARAVKAFNAMVHLGVFTPPAQHLPGYPKKVEE